jgi:8-oxo-dGTP pyrophosphatase MutT (NUDIX family)
MNLFAGVVLAKRGPLILVVTNRKYGGLCLPGGKGEDGENILQTAVREFKEESGLEIVGELRPIAQGPSCMDKERMVHVFLAELIYGSISPEEGADAYFTTWERLVAASPFKPFYNEHFPYGVNHFRNTNWVRRPF